MGELLERLRASTVFEAEVWKPKGPGDGIEGVVVHVETRKADPGRRISEYPIYRIRADTGEAWIWHASAQMAQEELERVGHAFPGDRIAVLFGGQGRAGNGNQFERWAVATERSKARLIHERMIAIEDVETRNRVKRTSARIHGSSLLRLDDQALTAVDTWLDQALAGKVELDPL